MYIFLMQGDLAALDGVQRGLDAPSLVGWMESQGFLKSTINWGPNESIGDLLSFCIFYKFYINIFIYNSYSTDHV